MSNDMSLDDIIKKNRASKMRNNRGPKKNVPNKGVPKGGKPNGTQKPGVKAGITTRKPLQDARFKIIQKKRKTIVDARDKLAQIAKQSDARIKLQKIRASNPKKVDSLKTSRNRERNGRGPSTATKLQATHSPRTSLTATFIAPPARPLTYQPPVLPQHHYVNEMLMSYNNGKLLNDYLLNHEAALRRTVSNNYAPVLPPPPVFAIKPTPFDWDKPAPAPSSTRNQSARPAERHRDYKVIPRAGMSKMQSSQSYKHDWSLNSKSRSIVPDNNAGQSKYYNSRNQRDGVKSRLDSPPSKPRGNANSRPKPTSQSAGYRIVVSNLQANVTQEDIKELFEDVGELMVSRLVRPGIAEVIYKTLKDASKAVDTYHNRQLDGHPMKCLLVNPRSKGSSSTSSGRVLSQSRGSGNHYSQPSLGTVHRALFD